MLKTTMPLNNVSVNRSENQFSKALRLLGNYLSPSTRYSPKAQLFRDLASHIDPLNLDYIYQRAVDGAREILQANRVVIYSLDEHWNGTITVESVAPGYTESIHQKIKDTCIKDSKGGLYKNGRVRVINDIYNAGLSGCHIKVLETCQIKANMVVPMLKGDQLLGLMIAHQCDQPRIWQQHELNFLVQLATQVALYSSDVNVLEQRAKAAQAHTFSHVALRIRRTLDFEYIFNTAAVETRQVLNVDRVIVCRLDSSFLEGTVVAESVVTGWSSMLGCQLKLAGSGVEEDALKRFKNGYVRPISNILQGYVLKQTNITLKEQYLVKASLVAPIWTGKKLVGLLIAHQCSIERTWEESTMQLFEELTAQVGLALEQTTLFNSVATEVKRTQLLADFTSRIRQSFNEQDIFSTNLKEILNTLRTDRVLIYRFNADGMSGEITSQAVAPGWTAIQGKKFSQLFVEENQQGYKSDNVWVTHNVDEAKLTPAQKELLEQVQIKASVVAPIVATNQLVGLLCVYQCSSYREWQQSEFYLLKQLAAQIGFALDQANLIEQVRVNAVSTQQYQQSEALRRQLNSLIEEVEGVAKGDLTIRAEVTSGEIGTIADFFNTVIESLQKIVTQVKLATTQVNASLNENSQASHELSSLSLKQVKEMTRALDSVEQMTGSIQAVAENARQAAAVAKHASTTALVGGEAIDRTVQKIWNLQNTVAATARKVERLGKSSQEISQVVSLIQDIALQTNVLALNAGIEASRAAEESQGFAVVAKEVGKLAMRSAEATQTIEKIVANIQSETNAVVKAMASGTTQVVEGTHLVEETKQSLGRILEVSHQIDQLVESISLATVSQAETSIVVTEVIKEMVKVSENTSSSSRQISNSLQQTVVTAQQLQEAVEVFKVVAPSP